MPYSSAPRLTEAPKVVHLGNAQQVPAISSKGILFFRYRPYRPAPRLWSVFFFYELYFDIFTVDKGVVLNFDASRAVDGLEHLTTHRNKNERMKIIIINGPNLNLLGKREPQIYGSTTFGDYFSELQFRFQELQLEYYQSNLEGELINKLHECGFGGYEGIVLNAGAYTHTSIGIGDAVKGIDAPVVEVHISNTFAREEFRHQSYISASAKGVILGFGLRSYDLAIKSFL